jgi:glutamyl-tRNA synthetase
MPHIGTLFQAMLDYVYAKKNQGQFIVRIEDTDQSRFVEGAEEAIFDSLAWLGLTPDESPVHPGSFGPYRQSQRLAIYAKHAQTLIDKQHAYYCFCSSERLEKVRAEMQKEGKAPMYDKHCRGLDPIQARERAKLEPHVVRLKVPSDETIVLHDEVRGYITFESNVVDDQVLIKSDGFPTYHLAVVVDDREMNITHVVRGEEWISSSPKHLLLYRYFDWSLPKFIHTPLLRNPDKSKLSKRHGHASVSWYVSSGYLPEAVINFLSSRVWNHPEGLEIYGIEELIKHFDFGGMHIQGPIVDLDKLNWINGQWIRSLSDIDLAQRLEPFVAKKMDSSLLMTILPLIKDRLVTLADINQFSDYFLQDPEIDVTALIKQSKRESKEAIAYLESVKMALSDIEPFDSQSLESTLRVNQEASGFNPRQAFMTLRYVFTGKDATPPLFDVMAVLGKETCVKRLSHSIEVLQHE